MRENWRGSWLWLPEDGCVEQEADGSWVVGRYPVAGEQFAANGEPRSRSLAERLGMKKAAARTSLEDSRRQNFLAGARQTAGCACARRGRDLHPQGGQKWDSG
jgi:hypothetical protein